MAAMKSGKLPQETLFFVWKIIEGALRSDEAKVRAYADHLLTRFEEAGESTNARRLRQLLEDKSVSKMGLAGAAAVAGPPVARLPVDSESRLAVADQEFWAKGSVRLVLNPSVSIALDRFLRHFREADKLTTSGLGISPSMLLYGPPGTGKTQVARYIASELGLPLLVSRSDGLISSYLGSTAKNVRSLFTHAASRPCVLFLDEFDALAKMRDDQGEVGELKRVVISLLQNIDALGRDHLLIAATNHEHLLDSAIWRRFAHKLQLGLPDLGERRQLVEMFSGGRAQEDVLDIISVVTADLSGAQIRDICEHAFREAVLNDSEVDLPQLISLALENRHAEDRIQATGPKFLRTVQKIDPKFFTQRRLAQIFGLSQSTVFRELNRSE